MTAKLEVYDFIKSSSVKEEIQKITGDIVVTRNIKTENSEIRLRCHSCKRGYSANYKSIRDSEMKCICQRVLRNKNDRSVRIHVKEEAQTIKQFLDKSEIKYISDDQDESFYLSKFDAFILIQDNVVKYLDNYPKSPILHLFPGENDFEAVGCFIALVSKYRSISQKIVEYKSKTGYLYDQLLIKYLRLHDKLFN